MLKNYIKIAYRSLRRNQSYALINITGLSVGIAACLIIFLVLQFETSFDTYHSKKDRIVRVVSEWKSPEGTFHSGGVPFPVAEALRTDFPQLEKVAFIFNKNGKEQITIDEETQNQPSKKFKEEKGVFFVEPQFLDIFDFSWLAGDPKTALLEPNSAVLTKITAERYFGDWKAAMGKSIKYNNQETFKITGILDDLPPNTDFPIKVAISFKSYKNNNEKDWTSVYSDNHCYVLLPPEMSMSEFNSALPAFVKKYKPKDYLKESLIAQPLSSVHYDERFGNFNDHIFSKELIKALFLIALFLLIIACVNFINLATAQAVNRSKEVGVRKVLGSKRSELALQFLTETALITLIAVIVSIVFAFLALPFINQILQVKLSLNLISNPVILLFLASVLVFVTLLSGFYPSIVLSRFSPIKALKSKFTASMVGGISLRRGLVVLQFTIAQVLIIGMLIVVNQMDFFTNAFLGFDKEAIINVPIPEDSLSKTKIDFLRNELKAHPGIKEVSFSFASPANNGGWNSNFNYNKSTKDTEFSASLKWADAEYFKTYNIPFVAGRPYYPSDTVREFVVNETLLKKLGIRDPNEALGKEINFWGGRKVGLIVGVVKDFHASSLRDPLSAVVLSTWKDVYGFIGIKLKGNSTKETLSFIENIWNKSYPEYVYEYEFLDEKINNFYKEESKLSQLYKIFAGISIFLSCLGLYGLMSFMAIQRTKEVGIRKTLGASISQIVYLFSKEFTLLITIAFLIAAPIAYYLMNQWLENFEYKVDLEASIFLLTILFSLAISWLTVGYKAIKAAMLNPVKSLKSE